jgi:acyl-CoA thioester hydrolase
MQQSARRGAELLCEAQLRVGFITLDGRPRRQPAAWRDAFRSFMNKDD